MTHTQPGHDRLSSVTLSGLRRLNPLSDTHGELADWRTGRTYALGDVNIFAGRNGAGKSTVLDLIDFLRNPDRICTLPRENRKLNSHCVFELLFESGSALLAAVVSNAVDTYPPKIPDKEQFKYQGISLRCTPHGGPPHSVARNIGKATLDGESREILMQAMAPLQCRVSHWDQSRREPIPERQMALILNKLAPHLCGLASDSGAPAPDLPPGFSDHARKAPVVFTADAGLAVYHSDDQTQFNCVAAHALPSGWRSVASLIHYLQAREPGEICLMEEPDIHLHPRLQRVVAEEMSRAVRNKHLQLFISTHSMTLQSPFLWPESLDLKLFELNGHEMLEGINERRMLDNLGVQAAEYGSCNGVVWVEGPSDRIYLKHWMSLYCAHQGIPTPVEHADYAFAFHGGSLLSHLAVLPADGQSNISKIHRNFVVLMDRDDDFDATGNQIGPSAKQAILDGITGINHHSCVGLLTPAYTVESSLPAEFRRLYFEEDANQRLRHVRGKKVGIAMRYAKLYSDWETCFDPQAPMRGEVADIVGAIRRWNGIL